MMEFYLPIRGLEGRYAVSASGRIKGLARILSDGRAWRGREVKAKPGKSGHMHIYLDGRWWLVHRLVLEAFVGPCPDGKECAHNNGQPDDNRVENLRWDTRKGNHADKRKHGTLLTGERNNRAKLTAAQVEDIRAMHRNGALGKDIAAAMGVTPANVSCILKGKTWRAGI